MARSALSNLRAAGTRHKNIHESLIDRLPDLHRRRMLLVNKLLFYYSKNELDIFKSVSLKALNEARQDVFSKLSAIDQEIFGICEQVKKNYSGYVTKTTELRKTMGVDSDLKNNL